MSFWRRPESRKFKTPVIPVKTEIQKIPKIMKSYYVYILTSKRNGTLYIGVTNDLLKRVYQHKNNLVDSFTKKYNAHSLVYYEQCDDIESVIIREKQLKKWNRKWKLELIEKENPQWKDLYEDLL